MPGVRRQFAVTLFLIFALLSLTPIAQASPPDQTWIGGFYDDADYDDVVLIITSSTVAVDIAPLGRVQPKLFVVAQTPGLAETYRPQSSLSLTPTRAPPLA